VEYGLLLLRLVVGLLFAAHGVQKLFGWFGGGGPAGTAGFFASLGYRWPARMAIVAGLAELGGGLMLATGFLTPLASFLLATVMLNAIVTVVFPKGFLGGYEFETTLATVAVALAATGPGELSLDDAIGWADELSGILWASLVLSSAIVISVITTTLGRGSADLDDIPG
jgi:putative oxidoreductase